MIYRSFVIAFALLLLGGDSFALKPRKDYIITPDSLHLNYKELKITTPDNFKINTWVMHPSKQADNKTVMVLAYGDAMNMSYWVEQCYYFVQYGYTVISFDYRGFGHSSPFPIDTNQLYYEEFATDLGSVLDYARTEFKGYKIGIRAMSMGTIMGVLAGHKAPFDFFVGDSFVCDSVGMKNKFLKEKNRSLTLPPGAEQYKDLLPGLKMPMIVFAGTKDNFTTLADSKAMVAQSKNRKLVSYEGGHLEGIYVLTAKTFGDKYIGDINGFLSSAKILK